MTRAVALVGNRDTLRGDVVEGLTTAAVVIPKAMAYATIAGLPIEIGLYTAFVPMLVYAVLGTSRPLSVSTTTTLAILTAAAGGLMGECAKGVQAKVQLLQGLAGQAQPAKPQPAKPAQPQGR